MDDPRIQEEKDQEARNRKHLSELARRKPTQEQLRAMAPPELPGFVVLGRLREGGNACELGLIENSFSMGESSERTQFHWSSDNVTSNLGGRFKVDGRAHAEDEKKRADRQLPQYEWTVYDVHDPDIPVLFDWDEWRAANARGYTLAGVIDKFRCRNVRFFMKE